MEQGEFTRKIDVLDLLIEVLAGHEKNLDELVGRLEEHRVNSHPFSVEQNMRYETIKEIEKLFVDAQALYADKSLAFDKVHKRIAEPFMEIMKEDALKMQIRPTDLISVEDIEYAIRQTLGREPREGEVELVLTRGGGDAFTPVAEWLNNVVEETLEK